MANFLDKTYTGAAYLAGIFMILVLVAVMANILGRIFHFDASGMDAYAGYSMAASCFLALAHTLRRGEHIRVMLFLQSIRPSANRLLEIICHVVAIAVSGTLSWFSARLVWQSHVFRDVSTGLDATPLWIPQIGMVIGTSLLTIALAQELVEFILNRRRANPASSATPAHIE